ncbi:MAG: CDP-2,3-bis-(O-geranylgeranyl)-sn-glycerol synthase [Candidatus Caldarchaeum sp.]
MELQAFLQGLVYVFPAYVANAAPVVAVRFFSRTHPIDRGLMFFDGRRVLGDGKTVEGFVSGTGAGMAVGYLIHVLVPPLVTMVEVFLLSFGALAGDVLGAFVKRRAGIPSGGAAPLLDQLGFLVVALGLVELFHGLPVWLDALTLLALALFTVLMHVGTNAAAYLLGLKDRWY